MAAPSGCPGLEGPRKPRPHTRTLVRLAGLRRHTLPLHAGLGPLQPLHRVSPSEWSGLQETRPLFCPSKHHSPAQIQGEGTQILEGRNRNFLAIFNPLWWSALASWPQVILCLSNGEEQLSPRPARSRAPPAILFLYKCKTLHILLHPTPTVCTPGIWIVLYLLGARGASGGCIPRHSASTTSDR